MFPFLVGETSNYSLNIVSGGGGLRACFPFKKARRRDYKKYKLEPQVILNMATRMCLVEVKWRQRDCGFVAYRVRYWAILAEICGNEEKLN